MKYSIKQESDIQAIIVEASGMINTKVAEEMVLAFGVELNNTGFQKCFIDLTNTEIDPDQTRVDMYMFINVYRKAGIDRSVKMAALISSYDDYRFFLEKAAEFDDFKLKHFTNKDEAFNWLCR
jgi:hypothetical protein